MNHVHEIFSRVAGQFGNSIAIRRGEQHVSYRELEERSNQFATALLSRGATRSSLVAILLADRVEVITAIIGALKAGCVFVPLDPQIPANRLKMMIEQVSPDWFVSEAWQITEGCHKPPVNTGSGEMCYIYFTSGSTGKPKAIAGALKGVDHFIDWEIKTFGIDAGTRISQFTSPSFDASLRDIFVPLCAHGTICIPPSVNTLLDTGSLVRWIDDEQLNLIHCVPSLFRAITNQELQPNYFPALRYVLLAGEPLLPADVRRWMDVFGERIQLVNLYGPSETTLVKFCYFVKAADKNLPSIPIGKPMPGARALLVDAHGKACRPGKVGEIYIRTPYRTIGYYNEPQLTSEVFIQNPFNDDPNDIVYKTGDLGRLLDSGDFEFVGRRDQQIKIRGVRVELKEIENVLRSHEAVDDVAVIDYQQANGDGGLCAYVALNRELATEELQDFMRDDLPEVMVPAAFIVMNALPRTFNGKIDRRALPQPDPERNLRQGPVVAPRNSVEEIVARVWAEVLGIKQISIHDNFVNLGGHSLRMTQVTSRLSKAFGIEIPLRALFESPTIVELAERIETIRLSNEGRRIAPLARVARDGELPLSFSQQRLWFLHQLDPVSTVYNLPMAARLRGRLDLAALQRSLNEMARRHEVLRTTFQEVDGKPLQIISPLAEIPLRLVDLSDIREPDREARRLIKNDSRRPFSLAEGPLIRISLMLIAPDEYVLLVNQHHIISDAWSTALLIQEVASLYESFSHGRPAQLPELPLQYADYAHWQQNLLQNGVLASQLSYWKDQLAAVPPVLPLPVDRPRPAAPVFRGARRHFSFAPELSSALANLSRQESVSLFMTLLAGFQTLLSRYTGQQDIIIGSPIAGRNHVELEGLIGFFVNTLVLRTDLSGNPTFQELLKRVRATCLSGYANQDVSFERLIQHLQPERSLNRTPLFQVMMTLQNVPLLVSKFGDLDWEALEIEDRRMDLDLVMSLMDTADGVVGLIDYSADLFDETTIGRLLDHFQTLLESIVADPAQRIEQLPLMTAVEREQILVEWNANARKSGALPTIPELFEAQVTKAGDVLAIQFKDQRVSYKELNARANQLAHYLRSKGIGPEACVGISLQRSIEMVVGLLGILKAGAAYVPLEPSHPAERINFMLAEAQVRVVVTRSEFRDRFADCEVVLLDEVGEPSTTNPAPSATQDNPAYVIFTSGSTGRPKGVMVPHGAIANTLLWRKETFALSESDRVFQNIPYTFDPSVWQIFGALISGAALVLATPEQHQDVGYVIETLINEEITITDFPPSMLQLITQDDELRRCSRLRIVFSGGDVLPIEVQERFFARLRSELYNQYGPSEAAIDAASWRCERNGANDVVPIGRPIADKQIYLLDSHLQPVPIGVAGELYIGGPGLARGYANQPGLTAERFLPHPFSEAAGARLYKTGDLARYRPSGDIEFMGRIDHQVKIRGNRVELGEVEALLNQHPAVRECVVVAQDSTGLVAFFVADHGHAQMRNELRNALREKLPEYMVPSAFVALDELPRTASGKVDRAALPVIERGWREQSEGRIEARTPIEEVLCGIWASVLGLECIGINEDFFDLGGHSLLATQVVSRVRKAFPVEIPLRLMFEATTVSELAQSIDRLLNADRAAEVLPALVSIPRDQPLPLSFAQQRLWFIEQLHPGTPTYNMPLAVRLTGEIVVPALERALNEIVRRHEVLHTSFLDKDGNPTLVVHESSPLTLTYPEQEIDESLVRQLAKDEARRPFDLSRSPLLRATLLRLSDTEHVLLLTTHHIVSDGWSMGVLTRELASLYDAFSKDQPSPLPELRIQYADFANWQLQRLDGEAMAAEIDYWNKHLGGNLPVLDLPTDRPRARVRSFSGAVETLLINRSISDAIKTLTRREGATLFMTLLAAFAVLLSRLSGQDDILVGTPVANRNEIELEGLIGFFVNTLVLRTDLSGNPTFRELLAEVRERALGAYMHQELPFEELVKELQPERDLSRAPLFQVMFVYQDVPRTDLKLPGLKLRPLSSENSTAKFDLTLMINDSPEGLQASLEYNRDLFQSTTITRLLDQFETLLGSIVAAPETKVRRLSLMSAAEVAEQLKQPSEEFETEGSLASWFEAVAARRREATAVVCGGEQLSYGELNERANQLAHYLRKRGVGPEVRVGLSLERVAEMVIGLLGIVKAGGAYVPLEQSYPQARLEFMIADAGTQIIVTHETFGEIEAESTANPVPSASAENALYVIYTSGTTGKPKGTVVTQGNVQRLFQASARWYEFDERDVWTLFHSYGFDFSVWEMWGALLYGGKLVVVPYLVSRTPAAFYELLRREQVTVLNQTPSAFWQLQQAVVQGQGSKEELPLRLVIFGGEALAVSRLREWYEWYGEAGPRLVNMYGITETTVHVSYRELGVRDVRNAGSPIGRALPDLELYVLDEELKPVPVGVPGELYVGGRGLARGYLNQGGLTAARFVPHPYSGRGGKRLYRSGDRGRRLASGEIEYLGRMDQQVKIRGHRVELAEIESVLATHAAVKEAVVIFDDAEERLVAYVVPQARVDAKELRDHVRNSLPEYMTLSALVQLEKLPLTGNGKIDRAALPVPSDVRPDAGRAYVAPQTPVELQLAQIWEQILSVQPVGIHDNFFELGGHSFLALRLMGQIHKRFGQQLPLVALFAGATIQDLALLLQKQATEPTRSPLVAIQPSGSKPPFYCVHEISGSVLGYVNLARYLGADQPVYGLQPAEGPYETLQQMAAHYIDEIRKVQPEGPYHLGGWSSGGLIAFEMAQQLTRQEREVALLALLDTAIPSSNGDTELDDATLLAGLARVHNLPLSVAELKSADDQLRYLLDRANLGDLADNGGLSHLRHLLDSSKSILRAGSHYRPRPYPKRITLFRSTDMLPEENGEEQFRIYEDPALGWSKFSAEPIEVHQIPGTHFTLLAEPNVQVLAARLKTCLAG
jgi:amino acid adenylation domain-containing protein